MPVALGRAVTVPCDASPATCPHSDWLHALRTTGGIVSYFRPVPSCCSEILTAPKLQTAPAVCGRSTTALLPQPKRHPPSSAVPPAPEKHDPRRKKTRFNRRGEDSQSSRNPRGSLCCCSVAAHTHTRPRRLGVPAARLLLVLT